MVKGFNFDVTSLFRNCVNIVWVRDPLARAKVAVSVFRSLTNISHAKWIPSTIVSADAPAQTGISNGVSVYIMKSRHHRTVGGAFEGPEG